MTEVNSKSGYNIKQLCADIEGRIVSAFRNAAGLWMVRYV